MPRSRLWFSLCALCALCGESASAAPPNVVVILADDLGYGDLGCYNPQSKIPTPNLDRLAAEGMRFTDAHSPSAVCTPTRYALLTGRYAWRSRLQRGVLAPFDPPLTTSFETPIGSSIIAFRLEKFALTSDDLIGVFGAKVVRFTAAIADSPDTVINAPRTKLRTYFALLITIPFRSNMEFHTQSISVATCNYLEPPALVGA